MTHEEYDTAARDVAYLSACAVNGQVPDAARVEQMNLTALFQVAHFHLLTGITAMALESAGVSDEAFTQAKGKAIRKVALFDMERAAVLSRLDEAGIWYLPLKGCVLEAMYPRIGMREMADNDILIDDSRRRDVRSIMEGLGFTHIKDGGTHDTYHKEPVCNFEMHHALFSLGKLNQLHAYYQNVRARLLKDPDNGYGFHFSDEDFYVYMIAHEYKHYSSGGTGLRSLLDTYVYCRAKATTMDAAYVARELDVLGISDFEAQNRSLAQHLFGNEPLNDADERMLEYILSSGTYGTISNQVENLMEEAGDGPFLRTRYVFRRLFLPMDTIRGSFPSFAKHPILLPLLPLYRVLRALTTRRDRLRAELKALAQHQSKQN